MKKARMKEILLLKWANLKDEVIQTQLSKMMFKFFKHQLIVEWNR